MAKKAGFDIRSILNTESLADSNQTRKKISYEKLVPHKENHYSIDDIEELADAIEDVGLQQELVVKDNDNGTYTIAIGHRRHEAIKILVEERKLIQYKEIWCNVIPSSENEVITQLKLHLTNTTAREMTEYDKMEAVSALKKLIKAAKEQGIVIKGKIRDVIADSMNMGKTQVQKYISIEEQAKPEIKDALKKGEITVQGAYDTIRSQKASENTQKVPKSTFDSEKSKKTAERKKVNTGAIEAAIGQVNWKQGKEVPKYNCCVGVLFKKENKILRKVLYFKDGTLYLDADGISSCEMIPLAWYEWPELPEWAL